MNRRIHTTAVPALLAAAALFAFTACDCPCTADQAAGQDTLPAADQTETPKTAARADGAPILVGAEPGLWTMDIDAARELAKAKNLPLLINFTGSDWCGWCKLMEEKVFSQETWKAYAKENAVLVWIDFPKDRAKLPAGMEGRNAGLAKTYGVRGYPTFVVLSPEGKEIGRLGASRDASPESFIGQLNGITGR